MKKERKYHGISFDFAVGFGSHDALLKVSCWGYSRSLTRAKCFNASIGVRLCENGVGDGRFGKFSMLHTIYDKLCD